MPERASDTTTDAPTSNFLSNFTDGELEKQLKEFYIEQWYMLNHCIEPHEIFLAKAGPSRQWPRGLRTSLETAFANTTSTNTAIRPGHLGSLTRIQLELMWKWKKLCVARERAMVIRLFEIRLRWAPRFWLKEAYRVSNTLQALKSHSGGFYEVDWDATAWNDIDCVADIESETPEDIGDSFYVLSVHPWDELLGKPCIGFELQYRQ